MRTNLQIHFIHHHVRDTIVILKEVKCHHPRCPACGMFVPRKTLDQCHPINVLFTQGADQNRWPLAEEEARLVA